MSDNMLFTSLAALAAMDTTDVKVLKNRLQKAGLYIIGFTEVGMSQAESNDPDAKPRVNIKFTGVIQMFQPLANKDGDTEGDDSDLVGKAYNEFYTLWMDDLAEAIGLLKGRYVSAHLPASGVMGGIPETTGWLDGIVGKSVAIRVTHKQKGDDTRVYYDWLGYKAMKKLDLDWEELQREPVDVNGNPIEIESN